MRQRVCLAVQVLDQRHDNRRHFVHVCTNTDSNHLGEHLCTCGQAFVIVAPAGRQPVIILQSAGNADTVATPGDRATVALRTSPAADNGSSWSRGGALAQIDELRRRVELLEHAAPRPGYQRTGREATVLHMLEQARDDPRRAGHWLDQAIGVLRGVL